MQQSLYHAWLKRESLPRDSRSHAPDEVRSKCLDLSSICIADEMLSLIADRLGTTKDRLQQQILDGTIAPELSTSDAVEEISGEVQNDKLI